MFMLVLVLLSSVDASKSCSSFEINGTTPAYFDYYRFYDFVNFTYVNQTQKTSSLPRSLSVNDSSWLNDWTIRVQNKTAPSDSTIQMSYIADNVFIENGRYLPGSSLMLFTDRVSQMEQTAAEIDFTAANITHGSLRMMARVVGDAGAVAAIFTYHNDTSESDTEILTKDVASRVRYSNQPTTDSNGSAIAGSTINATLTGGGDYGVFNTYRMDWLDGESVWYVNGEETARSKINVPSAESMAILNMWSNAGLFSGSMKVNGSAFMQVRWVEMAFNASKKAAGGGSICALDKVLGTPVPSNGVMPMWMRSGWEICLVAVLIPLFV